MTEKQKLINAFKNLDFENLNTLLDEKKSYMDVSKSTFIHSLKKQIKKHKELMSYDKVSEGICNSCNKGCVAYKFQAKDLPSLNLYFEEKNGTVNDIYLCHDLKVDVSDENEWDIYFNFYEEEKVNFIPSLSYTMNLQKIEKAIEEFKEIEVIGLVPIENVVHWYKKHNILSEELKLNDPFKIKKYKAHKTINLLYSEVSNLVHNYTKNNLAKIALKKFYGIEKEDEKRIIKWLLENENQYFFSLKKTDNWKKTGIIILETKPNLIVDCSGYLESFIFDEIYYSLHNEIMTKYKPKKEHYEQNGGSVNYSLETFLKLHNKYLNLF